MNATVPVTAPAVDLHNSAKAFASKSDHELRLAYWLFRLVRHPLLVKAGGKLTLWAVETGLPVEGLIRKTLYRHFCGGENLAQAEQVIDRLADQHVDAVLDYAAEAQADEAGFDCVRGEIIRNIRRAQQNPHIHCISLKMTGLGPAGVLAKLQAGNVLTIEEELSWNRTRARLDRICAEAAKAGISVYIDAEESWLQDPVDALTEEMMLRYNHGRAVVFNTLQMYRTDRLAYLQDLLLRLPATDCVAGIKLVRGAYLEKEQKRARQLHYPSPVFSRKVDTDRAFDTAADLCLQHLHRLELCAATHNEPSTQHLVTQIRKFQLSEKERAKISFSQLYGMSDNITYNLAEAGFRTSKYLPYGHVKTTLPYLLRRAEENTSISGQMGRELQLLQREMARRGL